MKVLVVLLLLTVAAEADEGVLPVGVTCTDVQQHYNRWNWAGRAQIRAYLKQMMGWTVPQVHAAERCVRNNGEAR